MLPFILFRLDAFEQLEEESGTRQGLVHIRLQQRTGRKTITTVQGIAREYDLGRIVRHLKKVRSVSLFIIFVSFGYSHTHKHAINNRISPYTFS